MSSETTRTTYRRESRRHFRKRVDAALENPRLQQALTEAMTGLREQRRKGFESQDFETGRDELKRRRQANLDRLPELIDQFRQRLEAVGGRFHFARTDAEAREIIAGICQSAGAGIVTKSKSMATEEIFLNQHLESLGMEVVETDLGEYIVQRLHQHPSHLIAPAVHLTVEDWAEELGTAPDRDAIMAHARQELRQKFIDASVGISGANAAIAETGTVMIVTNEGNADLTITLPRVHVALFGMDKLVASLDDAVAMLRMLPRSATGQLMSAYVNWVTGPSRSSDIGFFPVMGAHGPREMHCVVLDNGRTDMLAQPLFADALTCIRCGACSNACPSFMAVGGHQFGHIYSGPIGLVLTPFHHGLEADELPQSLCTQCNACEEICPVGIPLPRQILEHRRHSHRKPLAKQALLELWSRPSVARAGTALAAPVSRLFPLGPAPLASRSLRSQLRANGPPEAAPVTIFASCLVDRMTPEAGLALNRILRAAGHRVEFPAGQWCCGLICANAGDFEKAEKLGRRLVQDLAGSSGPIVTPSASCFGAVTLDLEGWGEPPPGLPAIRERMVDSTRFLVGLLESRPELVRAPEGDRPRVAYHDSCQSKRQLGLVSEPRRVLELAGYEVVNLVEVANCCGFGGTFSMEWPEVADRMVEWKLAAVAATGCSVVASDNPGCLMHIRSGAARRGLPLRVAHILELVAERLA
ncbi:MAG: LUD domain-containing protein [Candidatus Dormibacteraeota bacterium]|nr:LUD domain-containing protein [Candidatus Dormibacteraeota bacterium]